MRLIGVLRGQRQDRVLHESAGCRFAAMIRALRTALTVLVVLGLAMAGPLSALCAAPSSNAAPPCSCMTLDAEGPEQPCPEPAKACSILQCPTASPALGHAGASADAPISVAARAAPVRYRTLASADPAPEQRPPIS
jgi:hypothetical protein